ncbi:MFS transporter [Pantoea sp. Tr-811]|uniref:MFS transporter n=1 Tax=unclassified Pantoea TaxID=2630326 RepID=UPI00141EAB2E|nr:MULTISPECIES: MFS transporter [unclassified Pantoea]NIE72883.1 MFS transporter [Pantoea sp. Ap-967]NIF24833.1 MFS transporter [Pantoea sp. Tr-811]
MHNNNNTLLLRAALIYIAATALIIIGVQPIFIGLVAERLGLNLSQQGWVLSGEMTGTLLGCLLLPVLGRRFGGRGLYLGAALAALALNLASAALSSLGALVLCRLACGLAAGVLYAGAVSGLGRLPGQDRSYGLSLLIQTAVFALYATCLPQLAEQLGNRGAVATLGFWFVLIALAALAIPHRLHREAPAEVAGSGLGSATLGRYALLGMLCLQLAIYCIWGFVDQLARERGIGAVDVGWAFGLGILGGLPGGALPSVLGARVSRGPMIGLGSVLVLVSIGMLARFTPDANWLCLALLLMNFGWVLALTYYMGAITTNDPRGTLTPWVSILQVAAAALAPAFVALQQQGAGHETIFVSAAVAVVLGLVLKCLAGVVQRRARPA